MPRVLPYPLLPASLPLLQTLRKVKGILNKLTPEKFERLLSQLVPLVNSYEVVQVGATPGPVRFAI